MFWTMELYCGYVLWNCIMDTYYGYVLWKRIVETHCNASLPEKQKQKNEQIPK